MRDLVGKRQICKADMEKAQLWQEFDERIFFTDGELLLYNKTYQKSSGVPYRLIILYNQRDLFFCLIQLVKKISS